jgi:hypothetical protein
MAFLNSLQQVIRSVINTINDVSVTFGICCPLNDDLVKAMSLLELP